MIYRVKVSNPVRKSQKDVRDVCLDFDGREIYRISPGYSATIFLTDQWRVRSSGGDMIVVFEDVDYGEKWLQRVGNEPQTIDESNSYVPTLKAGASK